MNDDQINQAIIRRIPRATGEIMEDRDWIELGLRRRDERRAIKWDDATAEKNRRLFGMIGIGLTGGGLTQGSYLGRGPDGAHVLSLRP